MDEDEEAWFDEEEDEFIPFNTSSLTTTPTTTMPPSVIATPTTAATPTSIAVTPTSGYFVSMLTARSLPDPVSSTTTAISTSTPLSCSSSSSTVASVLGGYSPRPGTVGSRLQMLEAQRKTSPLPTISAVSLTTYQ